MKFFNMYIFVSIMFSLNTAFTQMSLQPTIDKKVNQSSYSDERIVCNADYNQDKIIDEKDVQILREVMILGIDKPAGNFTWVFMDDGRAFPGTYDLFLLSAYVKGLKQAHELPICKCMVPNRIDNDTSWETVVEISGDRELKNSLPRDLFNLSCEYRLVVNKGCKRQVHKMRPFHQPTDTYLSIGFLYDDSEIGYNDIFEKLGMCTNPKWYEKGSNPLRSFLINLRLRSEETIDASAEFSIALEERSCVLAARHYREDGSEYGGWDHGFKIHSDSKVRIQRKCE